MQEMVHMDDDLSKLLKIKASFCTGHTVKQRLVSNFGTNEPHIRFDNLSKSNFAQRT
ncbi:MAG: hypothetical protein LBG21_01660 [Campylobacteraceae bacterium]|jgi:hypothetical protein|nr:hypothetical protein [Campylobacteraceae bacterium]